MKKKQFINDLWGRSAPWGALFPEFINDLWGRSAPWGALFPVSWWKY